MRFRITARTGYDDLLDLPWDRPLAHWSDPHLVEVARGVHRHVVRFVDMGGSIYALKELPGRLADREYRLLRRLAEQSLPVVEVVGVVKERGSGAPDARVLEPVLITRHLDYALPYRTLFRHGIPDLRHHLLDALAGLLVRLHLVGFFWGDCSLSNTLFRRDAGSLAAYVVDAETGELHDELSDGQRRHDLDIAEENIAGGLLDVAAEFNLADLDPLGVALEVRGRYEALWAELVRDEVFAPHERYRSDARLRRLNELGFDVAEVEIERAPEGLRLRLGTHVVEPGHHRRRLLSLTGLDVQENQARRLLNDMAQFRAHLVEEHGQELADPVVAYRWSNEVFEPTIAAIPEALRSKREAAELFHQVLEHRYYRSEQAGRDIGLDEATASYVDEVLAGEPDERLVVDESSAWEPLTDSP